MKSTVLFIALIGAVWSFPKGEELKFKNVYVNPRVPVPKDFVPRIINGQESVPHSIPFQSYLIFSDLFGSKWLCGGSLITPSFVVTAGHCVDGAVSAEIYLGAHNTKVSESTRIIVRSEKLTLHEKYNSDDISNDIGLIELDVSVELNEYINVVSLPSREESNNDYEGANARISGWGLTDGHGEVADKLHEVNTTVISNTACDNIYGIVKPTEICTSGSGGVGSCNGDSGGPLVTDNKLIGIVSYGVQYCEPGYPSAFTRVTSYLDWIEEHTDLKF